MSMDPTIKAQWVAALRSGEYRQGRHVLHNVDENTYCCLGVLCDLAVKAGVMSPGRREWNSSVGGDMEVYGVAGDRAAQGAVTLPVEVITWAGLEDSNPAVYVEDEDGDEYLAELNDGYEYSFEQLAALVEDQL